MNIKKIFTPFEKVNKKVVTAIIVSELIIFGGLWELLGADLIPKPHEIAIAFVGLLSKADTYNDLITSLGLTIKAMFISLMIAAPLAYGYKIPVIKPIVDFIVKLRFLTIVGLIFTFTLLFHAGGTIKLSVLLFCMTPYFVSSILVPITKIEEHEYDLCRTQRFTRWETLYELVIVGRADTIIETLRINQAIAWTMITMVETLSMGDGGIGVMLYRYNKYNQLNEIFALQLIIFTFGIGFDWFYTKLRYAFFYHTKLAEVK